MLARTVTNTILGNIPSLKSPKLTATVLVRHFSIEKDDIVKIQNTADFKEKVLNSKVPVVVDFFAT